MVQQLQQAGYHVRGTVRSLKNEAKVQPIRELCPEAAHPLELVEVDLLDAESWPKVMEGCTYVIHIASPFNAAKPKDEDEVIKPAVDGTLNVLKAASAVPSVKRVVITSSTAAIFGAMCPDFDKDYSEKDFPDPTKNMEAYPKSKVMAERAAWDFVKGAKFELAVVNPGLVLGPALNNGEGVSNRTIRSLMTGEANIWPVQTPCIDVRDVARAHLAAMTTTEAAGKRHCLVTEVLWMSDLARMLCEEFSEQGYSVTKPVEPPNEKKSRFDTSRMRKVLKINPIPIRQSLVDMTHRLIEMEQLPRTEKYRGCKKN